MAEKIKKGFFKVLPLSVVILLVASLVVTFTMPAPQNPGVSPALAADNAIVSITLLDSDANGKMDKAQVVVDNDSTAAAYIFSTAGWSATDNAGVDPVTITAVAFDTDADDVGDAATAGTDPLTIIVDLDETNVTANDTLNSDLEIIYTQQGVNAGTEYDDSANTQLVAITTGDGGGAAVAEADGALPLVYAQVYQDVGEDGAVETAVLTFTEVVTFTESNANWLDDWAFTANNLTSFAGAPTAMVGTGTNTITFTVAATSNLTGVSGLTEPQFAFTKDAVNLIVDGTANELASIALTSLVDDANPVRYGAITYTDNGTDGTVDRVTMNFTEKVTYTYADADWTAVANGLTGFDVTACTSCTDVTSVVLTATTTGSITGVGAGVRPTLEYAYSSQYIQDATSNNYSDEGAGVNLTDGAAPYLVSATYSDSDADGKVDRVAFLFTEVTTWTTITAADWVFSAAGDVNLVGDFDAAECAGSGTLATITCTDAGTGTVDADANKTGKQTTGGAEPTFDYTNANNDINDGAPANNTATFGPLTLTDGAGAKVVTRVTKDTDSVEGAAGTVDGTMNGVLATFTEAMDASSVTTAEFAVTLNDDSALTETYGDTTDDTTLFFGVTDSTASDTSDLLKLQITGGTILDYSGFAMTNEGAASAATDGAAPYLVSGTYSDSDADGKVDRVVFVFTESTTWTTITVADWEFSVAGDINLTGDFDVAECTASPATTYTCTDAGTGTVDADANKTGKQTTGGTEPTFNYANANNDINDTINNTATFSLALTDGAAPRISSAGTPRVTKDTDSATGAAGTVDGDLDGVLATFTEAMDASSVAVTDFVITLNDDTAKAEAYSDTTDDTTLFFGLSDPTANDTSDLLKLQITGGDGILDYAGVSFAAEGAASAATDGAAPYLISATYRDDTGTDGAVDTLRTTWTENVTMSGSTAVDWTIVGGSITAAFSSAADDAVAGTTLDVTVTADAGETVSAVAPTIAYDNDDANDSVVDGSSNATGTMAAVTATDAASPVVVSATFYDTDATPNDGKLDIITVVWSENISAVADGSGDWALTSAANFAGIAEGSVVCNTLPAAANECDYNFTTTTVKTDVGDLSLAYTAGTSVTDGTNLAASKTITSASTPAFTDGADPVVASTSPADGATGVALDASFSITFSEAMTTGDLTTATIGRTPTFTLGSAAWTVSNTVVTFASHDAWAGLQLYSINLVEGSIKEAAAAGVRTLDNSAIVADPYTFTTVGASSGGGGGGGGGLPASVSVTTPNGGETLTGGGTYNVNWSAPGVADTINLYYSLDSGINFPNTIATGLTNDGSYTWTVPNISSSTVKVKAMSGSLSDISDANLTIAYTTPDVSLANSTVEAVPTSVVANGTSFSIITVTVKDAAAVPLSGKVVSLASSRGTSDTVTTVTGTTGADGKATFNVYSSTAGTSTYTATAQGTVLTDTVSVVFTAVGEPTTPAEGETPTSISVGDLIKSPLSTSVYYYGSDNKRHLFPNEKTYKSWYVDFSNIKSVTASQLQGIALGHNVTVRPGTVLLKIETDPKVYAVEPGGLLRWVPTEARALTLYGSAWASRIIDVPLVFWVDYSFGSDITTDQHPTGTLIKYTGTTDTYFIQGAERRLVSTAGFTANKFQLSNVLAAPTTISYTLGTPITVEDTSLTRIY